MKRKNIAHTAVAMVLVFAIVFCMSGCGGPVSSSVLSSSQGGSMALSSESSQVQGKYLPDITTSNYPRVDGSTANLPFIARIYSDICAIPREDAEAMVTVSGTSSAWRNLLERSADLLIVYEPAQTIKDEIESAKEKLEITPIGRDGLVFVVNKNNPIDSLTRQQLIDIYTGKITDWAEVGGNPGPIAPFQRNEESGSQVLFLDLLMKDTKPMEPAKDYRYSSMQGLIDNVANYDGEGGSIGFSVYYYANLMYANPELKLLKVDGIDPTSQTIGDGTYPLVNDFYVAIREGTAVGGPIRQLRDWLLTDEAAKVMREENYVPIAR